MSRDFKKETVECVLDCFVRLGEEDTIIAVNSKQNVIA
jgi:hypothetical protein